MAEDNRDNEAGTDDMTEAIIAAVEEPYEQDDDGLTKRERLVEHDKESERIRKAKELKKALRKRELGFLNYRWPAMILVVSGILSIWTEFLVTTMADDVALSLGVIPLGSFWEEFLDGFNIFFIFPLICGVMFIIIGYFAYTNPKATYLSAIPAMMMASAGSTVLFMITMTVTIVEDPINNLSASGHLWATGAPITMLIIAVMALLSIMLREKE